MLKHHYLPTLCALLLVFFCQNLRSQPGGGIQWSKDGNAYLSRAKGDIVKTTLPDRQQTVLADKTMLTPSGQSQPLNPKSLTFSEDESKVLLFTNSKRVWRYETKGDYWVLDLKSKKLQQLGKGRPASSLMFAKFSPNGQQVAYVSEHNIYVENLVDGKITPLTSNGTDKLINGTFDWAYEEEFDCRDGFRWSPDGANIAYWQIDAKNVKYFMMINNVDSIYAFNVPVEYPKVGETPSACRIGIVSAKGGATRWLPVPGDIRQNYIPRMAWAGNGQEVILQQLDRKQQVSKLYLINIASYKTQVILEEKDEAWVDLQLDANQDWDWINGGKEFLWLTEKDGWRHYYRISRDGKSQQLLTSGNYDVISPVLIDQTGQQIYFYASPESAVDRYLYRVGMDGKTPAQLVSPKAQVGTHGYNLSPNGKFATHNFSSAKTAPQTEWISLPDHKALDPKESIETKLANAKAGGPDISFFQVTTQEGVTMDGWMVKPTNFDPNKKYPVLFYVYSEPAGATVKNSWGNGQNRMYEGELSDDGYVYVSLDNRGTPAPKGRAWRKSIYRQIGRVNIRDQAQGALETFKKFSFIDTSRVAVWGWSGGGSATLNLLFQHPNIYKTGISIAAVADQLTYDNIYQERYMGLPQENKEDFVLGSPISHAKNLKGKLLYIHGTGDDNVHYQNAERLVNELIKHNKLFQFMPYPNRSHGIYEGEGTSEHLNKLYTQFLRDNCKPGGR